MITMFLLVFGAAPSARATAAKDLIGSWSFNSNGTVGSMGILSVHPRPLVSTLILDVKVSFPGINREDKWTGLWDERTKVITLTRTMQVPNSVAQTYTSYIGDNEAAHLILGGFFTSSDVPANAPRTRFGWCASWQGHP
jgi:hypothetical protein